MGDLEALKHIVWGSTSLGEYHVWSEPYDLAGPAALGEQHVQCEPPDVGRGPMAGGEFQGWSKGEEP